MKTFALFLISVPMLAVNVTVNGGSAGSTFEGVGALSAGATTRLLQDYPTQQQGEILDFLFKPNYGAALQGLKVEIGGDMSSGEGSEPSHERANGVINCNRGYEWGLMAAAVLRNPGIVISALPWGTAGWVGTLYSTNQQTYTTDWLTCASGKSLILSYLGLINETTPNLPWIITLKSALASAGFSSVLLEIDDMSSGSQWLNAPSVNSNSPAGLQAAVTALNAHYPYPNNMPTSAAATSGKKLFDSEEGFWDSLGNTGQPNWAGAQYIADGLNQDYITGRMTRVTEWALFTGYYSIFGLPNAGMMLANTPWSGNYTVQPPIWAIAHTTQFIQPGWQYLNSSGNIFFTTGSVICAKSNSTTDYSCPISTTGQAGTTTFNMTVSGGLSTGAVHLWLSTSGSQFIQQADVCSSSCSSYSFTVVKDAIATITTTTGQAKGSTTPPSSSNFPFPYTDNFDGYTTGTVPKYMSDTAGAFEIASCTNGHAANCLRQVVSTAPINWVGAASANHPASVIGDLNLTDFFVQSDVMLEAAGTVRVMGRVRSSVQSTGNIGSYQLQVTNGGAWVLTVNDATTTLASGTLGGGFALNTWHTLKLQMVGTNVKAFIDGTQLASVTDSTYSSGLAALGTTGFTNAQFDNFQICDPTLGCPVASVISGMGGAATLAGSVIHDK